jgi:L,D-peptidoglycan transpeptidase YkuD (ErfK/YbiS/YcfS/YnhG family)
MSRREIRYIIWSLAAFTVLLLSYYLIYIYKKNTIVEIPRKDISISKKSLTEARNEKADIYAADLYDEAVRFYDSALYYWKEENKRVFLIRDFKRSTEAARKSDSLANLSIKAARNISTDSRHLTTQQLKLIRQHLETLQFLNTNFKLPDQLNSEIRKLSADLPQLEIYFNSQNWTACNSLAKSMEQQAFIASKTAAEFLEQYFEAHNQWKKWVDEAINESRKNKSYAIIIDKTSGQCMLYRNGKMQTTYVAELGQNWIGDKQYEGDKTTPEGIYKVIEKKQGSQTRYYKALKINYPNEDDKNRFEALKQSGAIGKNTKIGGMIEIHGDGGKGYHWTDGCVALSNKDMDDLFRAVPLKTTVVIVGSLRPLSEIITF